MSVNIRSGVPVVLVTSAFSSGIDAGEIGEREVRAVIAHEIAHLDARDDRPRFAARTLAWAATLLVVLFAGSAIVAGSVFTAGTLLAGALLGMLAFAAWAVSSSVERETERRADRGAVRLMHGAESLAAALAWMRAGTEAYMRTHGVPAYSVDERGLLDRLFASHPRSSERIAYLGRSVAGG